MNPVLRALAAAVSALGAVNAALLRAGRQAAWVLIGLMVIVILVQVFFRYALNNALPWPEEAARACMIWMAALAAPSAYRWGGFVSINMLAEALPPAAGRALLAALLVLSGAVLAVLLAQSAAHFNSGFIFRSSTLKIPLAYIYAAMPVCFGLMMSVNTELLLAAAGRAAGGRAEDFPAPEKPGALGAE